jgi:CheY-like chemotaxis protein
MLMPKKDGWLVLSRLDAIPNAPPVIVMTGSVLTSEWAEQMGCAGFLKKPFEKRDLLAKVQHALEHSGQE